MRTAEADLKEIKDLMERSSRFISLSGLSGVFAGLYALAGAWIANQYVEPGYERIDIWPLVGIAFAVLTLSLLTAILFTTRNARRKNQKIWDKLSKRMLWNLVLPLIAGGAFLIILILQQQYYLVAPGMLIFYGLALINGSKYTLNDIRYLGYFQIILGLIGTWFYGHGLLFWSIGFGWLHINYGASMYWKYER